MAEDEPDFDKQQLAKNNIYLEYVVGKFMGVLDIKTDVYIEIQNLVKVSVESVCEKELKNKQDTIDELRFRVTDLETTIDKKEQIIQSTKENLRFTNRELERCEDKCDKKDQEISDLKSELSQAKKNYLEYKEKTEEAAEEFNNEKQMIKTKYEDIIRKLERELLDWKGKSETISTTVTTLEEKFASLSVDIKNKWSMWFVNFKEEMPKDLESLYEELRKRLEYEWTFEKEESIREQIEEEHNMAIAELETKINAQEKKIERLRKRTCHPEVVKNTELIQKIVQSETVVGRHTSITCKETKAFIEKAVDNNALEFGNTQHEEVKAENDDRNVPYN
ncbi:polyamine-modulated factor 1-binding protein 1-like [Mercenaria mercenaria]|uniref:polyamine-modulated factor 1-binding protein 1-like n=1 Tax=Mercenaria mercenaria TaxID=6596 RepID=UPI00234F59B9|nr:polyamine-modulated factor 1-binding protein 1-like [Mercenaria mercenaria]